MPGIRKSERVPILGDLHGEIMVFEPLQVKQLGLHGATIETAFPLPLNSLHDLRLTLGSGAVVVKARVVHSHVGEMGEEGLRLIPRVKPDLIMMDVRMGGILRRLR